MGELHCDHLATNLAENAFDYDSHDWNTMVRVVRGEGPLSPGRARQRGYPPNLKPTRPVVQQESDAQTPV